MTYTCKAICKLKQSSYQGFDLGNPLCSVCGKHFKTRNIRCECCGNILQVRPRAFRRGKQFYKKFGEPKRY